jgi:hypothetical protein
MLMNLLKWFWLYPAIAMTAWTVMTVVAAWTFRRNRAFPRVFGLHLMMMQLNPKDEILYQRPSAGAALGYLGIGISPVGGILLIANLAVATLFTYARVQVYFERRTKKQVST